MHSDGNTVVDDHVDCRNGILGAWCCLVLSEVWFLAYAWTWEVDYFSIKAVAGGSGSTACNPSPQQQPSRQGPGMTLPPSDLAVDDDPINAATR